MDKENTQEYRYMKAEFINNTSCTIPQGKVTYNSNATITIEELGGETHMFMKVNITHFFIGTKDES